MYIELVSAICVIAAGTLCGRSCAGTLERRCRLLEDLIRAVRILRIHITDMLEPLESALRSSGLPVFVKTADCLAGEEGIQEAWQRIRNLEYSRGGSMDCLSGSDISALNRLFDHVGESGRSAQDEAIRSCIAELEAALSDARERYSKVGKACVSIGFLAGLGAAIIVI